MRVGRDPAFEWTASGPVVTQVEQHYRDALAALSDSALMPVSRSAGVMRQHMAEPLYTRQLRRLMGESAARSRRFVGVLHAQHDVRVRHFSDRGETCIVVDYQSRRRVITYDHATARRVHVQTLDDGVLVCQMVYDVRAGRWLLADVVQSVPSHADTAATHHLAAKSHPVGWARRTG